MSVPELSDLMHTNLMEKGKFMTGCGSCCKQSNVSSRGYNVLESLILHQSCGRKSFKTCAI